MAIVVHYTAISSNSIPNEFICFRPSFFILIASACCGGSSLSESNAINSGFKSTITQRGVNHIRDILVAEIRSKISKIKLPNQEGKEHHIKYSVKDIVLGNLQFGGVNLARDGSGFRLTISNIGFDLHCKWHMRYHVVSDSGKVDLHIRNTKIAISLEVKATGDGKPAAKSHNPGISIGHLDVKFHGGVTSKFINLFKKTIAHKIKGTAESAVRTQMGAVLNQAIKKSLSSVQTIFPVDQYSDFDLRLMNIAYADNFFISPAFNGNFLPHGSKTRPPLPTNAIPSHINDRHIQIFLSEYMFNSGSYVYFHKGLLQQTITDKDIPQQSWIHLNTKSFKFIIPEMYAKYPDMPMQATIAAKNFPKLSLNNTNIKFNIPVVANLSVVTPKGLVKDLVSVAINVESVAEVHLSGMRIHGKVNLVGFKFNVIKSEFVKIDGQQLSKVINDLCKYGIVPFFNPALEKGLEIPITKGVTVKNPTLSFGKGFVAVTSDIDYTF
ncbi:hypothetical protein GEMRC1_004978 [Eukaryota sp. GEM-RC1]